VTLDVYKPGSDVTVNGLAARVVQVCVGGGGHVTYQLSWWDGRSRSLVWCDESEVSPPVETVTLGFKEQP
jgi:hypothetical protein